MKNSFRVTFPMILLIIWMGLIIYFSSDTATVSSQKSGFILEKVEPIIQKSSQAIRGIDFNLSNFHHIIRKSAHMFNYCVLGILAYLSYFSVMIKRMTSSICAIVHSTLFAMVDEYFQTFIPGRSGSPGDVMIDSIGIYCGVIIINLITLFIKKRKAVKLEANELI